MSFGLGLNHITDVTSECTGLYVKSYETGILGCDSILDQVTQSHLVPPIQNKNGGTAYGFVRETNFKLYESF